MNGSVSKCVCVYVCVGGGEGWSYGVEVFGFLWMGVRCGYVRIVLASNPSICL